MRSRFAAIVGIVDIGSLWDLAISLVHSWVATRGSEAMNTMSAPLLLQVFEDTPKGAHNSQLWAPFRQPFGASGIFKLNKSLEHSEKSVRSTTESHKWNRGANRVQ